MESNTISTLSSWAAFIATILPALALAYVWIRTRSSHLLRNRLWQLINGTQDVDDPEVKQVVAERTSLMNFRFIFGVQADSLAHAQRVMQWARQNEADMTQVADCGYFFDLETMDLRSNLPSPRKKQAAKALYAVPLVFTLAAFMGAGAPAALVTFKETGRWFWLTKDSARVLSPTDATPLRREDCVNAKTAPLPPTGFSPREVEIVCNVFAPGDQQAKDQQLDVATFVRDAIDSQRMIAAVLLAAAVGIGLMLFSFLKSIETAVKLRKRLDERAQAAEGRLIMQD